MNSPRAFGWSSCRAIFALGLLVAGAVQLADAAGTDALKALSLEELLNVEVTSVSRSPERLIDAPAAIQVISGEDIRRSGATSLPEALRLANNLNVARKNAHDWAVSARGFNTELANKLLVLIDGRTIYTPLFSGVRWDAQDYLLHDLDRIEVVSGPGGSLWGANAVNGVINITSKRASETLGWYAETQVGEELGETYAARYGTRVAPNVYLRVYGKYSDRRDQVFANGANAGDDWSGGQAGFRLDAETSTQDIFTLQGDVYDGERGVVGSGTGFVDGRNLLARWSRGLSNGSDLRVQAYYDCARLSLPFTASVFGPAGRFSDDLETYDFELQHSLTLSAGHRWVWGATYRATAERSTPAPGFGFDPANVDQVLTGAFAQGSFALTPDVSFIAGSKLEHNSYTGWEVEPNIRLQRKLGPESMAWAAISRAVRTPSRVDRSLRQPSQPPVLFTGSNDFTRESVIAYELGYRSQLTATVSAAVSTFYNQYDDIRSVRTTPTTLFPLVLGNDLEGDTYGFELNATMQAAEWWRVTAAYTLLRSDIHVRPGGSDINNGLNETSDPEQQVLIRSSMTLANQFEIDGALRWVDTLHNNVSGKVGTVPAYAELDLRLGWNINRNWEFSLVGQNLLHDQHPEFGAPSPDRVEVRRRIFAKLAWEF